MVRLVPPKKERINSGVKLMTLLERITDRVKSRLFVESWTYCKSVQVLSEPTLDPIRVSSGSERKPIGPKWDVSWSRIQ